MFEFIKFASTTTKRRCRIESKINLSFSNMAVNFKGKLKRIKNFALIFITSYVSELVILPRFFKSGTKGS